MSWVSAVAGVAGGILGAIGTSIGANQKVSQYNFDAAANIFRSKTADYQATVADNNALIAEMAGERVVQAGTARSMIEGLKTAATVGRTKAVQAANNIDVNTGSAVGVRADISRAGYTSASTLLSDAQLTNWGFKTQANTYRSQAALDRAQASLYRAAGAFDTSQIPLVEAGAGVSELSSLLGSAKAVDPGWFGGSSGGGGGGSGTSGSASP